LAGDPRACGGLNPVPVIEWLASLDKPGGLPAAWLLDADAPELRREALALTPTGKDLARAGSRPQAERESVLVRRGLVRLCVGMALGARAGDIAILWSKGGAPLLSPPFSDYRLSWAQRRNHFACALARQPIGIDIELADGGEIPWNALHEDEAAALRATQTAERDALFLRIWAAKEAYTKALGEGLRREPTEFAVHFEGKAEGRVEDPAGAVQRAARLVFALIDGAGVVALALIEG
jgi:4'-phosphopantetheinyl transferase